MPRFRSHAAAAMLLLPALTLSPAPGPHPVGSASYAGQAGSAWQLADSQHFGQLGNASGYSVILTVGRQVWVFGGTNPGGASSPVALSLAGHRWRHASLPAGLTDFISDASAPSAADIWAMSSDGRYVLHWNGRTWQLARRWNQPGVLSDVVALSPDDAWVFGTSLTGVRGVGTWQYDGKRWAAVTGIAAEIYRASATSRHSIWAIAAGQRSDAVVRLTDGKWHVVPTGRALAGIRWHDILAGAWDDVWLLGNTASQDGIGRLVLAHWNGERWTRFTLPLRAWAGQLAAAGHGKAVATATSSGILAAGLIVQISTAGKATWATIASSLGSGVSDAVFSPDGHQVWASGAVLTRLGGDAAIWVHAVRTADRRPGPGNPA